MNNFVGNILQNKFYAPAVTFCYQVHAPKTDTQLHTFLLRRYTVTHTVTHIPTAAIHSYTQPIHSYTHSYCYATLGATGAEASVKLIAYCIE